MPKMRSLSLPVLASLAILGGLALVIHKKAK